MVHGKLYLLSSRRHHTIGGEANHPITVAEATNQAIPSCHSLQALCCFIKSNICQGIQLATVNGDCGFWPLRLAQGYKYGHARGMQGNTNVTKPC